FPVVWWVWRRAGQWLYGVGPDDTGRKLHEAEEEDLAGVVAAAVRAQGAAIVTDRGDCPADSLCLPLGRGQYLVVHPRRAGESFTRRDREAVDRMAEHLSRRLERRDLERELVEAHTALASNGSTSRITCGRCSTTRSVHSSWERRCRRTPSTSAPRIRAGVRGGRAGCGPAAGTPRHAVRA